MFDNLHTVRGSVRRKYRRIRGRGNGSMRGGPSGAGGKGDTGRSGYKKLYGLEGGQVPLYRKSPIRGFTRGKFLKEWLPLSFTKIDQYFNDGEVVSLKTLKEKRLMPSSYDKVRLKIVNVGKLTKKVKIEAHGISAAAMKSLEEKSLEFKKIGE